MPNIGPVELVVILGIALLVLGPKKLPEVAKSLGRGIREFRDSISSSDARGDEPILPVERQAPGQIGVPAQPVVEAPVVSRSVAADDR